MTKKLQNEWIEYVFYYVRLHCRLMCCRFLTLSRLSKGTNHVEGLRDHAKGLVERP